MKQFPEPVFPVPVVPPTAMELAAARRLDAAIDRPNPDQKTRATPRIASLVSMIRAERRFIEADVFPAEAHALTGEEAVSDQPSAVSEEVPA